MILLSVSCVYLLFPTIGSSIAVQACGIVHWFEAIIVVIIMAMFPIRVP